LLCVVLLGFGVTALRRPSLGRLVWFGVASVVALPCSFPSAFIGPALFSLCALAYAYDQRLVAPPVAVRALGLLLIIDALCVALLLLIVHQKATPAYRITGPATTRSVRLGAHFEDSIGTDPVATF
jgi:apolipoprotein N-acyltransferase